MKSLFEFQILFMLCEKNVHGFKSVHVVKFCSEFSIYCSRFSLVVLKFSKDIWYFKHSCCLPISRTQDGRIEFELLFARDFLAIFLRARILILQMGRPICVYLQRKLLCLTLTSVKQEELLNRPSPFLKPIFSKLP